jgi:hypothetical protein
MLRNLVVKWLAERMDDVHCPTDDWRHFLAEVSNEVVANGSVFAKLLKHERIILLSLYDGY